MPVIIAECLFVTQHDTNGMSYQSVLLSLHADSVPRTADDFLRGLMKRAFTIFYDGKNMGDERIVDSCDWNDLRSK